MAAARQKKRHIRNSNHSKHKGSPNAMKWLSTSIYVILLVMVVHVMMSDGDPPPVRGNVNGKTTNTKSSGQQGSRRAISSNDKSGKSASSSSDNANPNLKKLPSYHLPENKGHVAELVAENKFYNRMPEESRDVHVNANPNPLVNKKPQVPISITADSNYEKNNAIGDNAKSREKSEDEEKNDESVEDNNSNNNQKDNGSEEEATGGGDEDDNSKNSMNIEKQVIENVQGLKASVDTVRLNLKAKAHAKMHTFIGQIREDLDQQQSTIATLTAGINKEFFPGEDMTSRVNALMYDAVIETTTTTFTDQVDLLINTCSEDLDNIVVTDEEQNLEVMEIDQHLTDYEETKTPEMEEDIENMFNNLRNGLHFSVPATTKETMQKLFANMGFQVNIKFEDSYQLSLEPNPDNPHDRAIMVQQVEAAIQRTSDELQSMASEKSAAAVAKDKKHGQDEDGFEGNEDGEGEDGNAGDIEAGQDNDNEKEAAGDGDEEEAEAEAGGDEEEAEAEGGNEDETEAEGGEEETEAGEDAEQEEGEDTAAKADDEEETETEAGEEDGEETGAKDEKEEETEAEAADGEDGDEQETDGVVSKPAKLAKLKPPVSVSKLQTAKASGSMSSKSEELARAAVVAKREAASAWKEAEAAKEKAIKAGVVFEDNKSKEDEDTGDDDATNQEQGGKQELGPEAMEAKREAELLINVAKHAQEIADEAAAKASKHKKPKVTAVAASDAGAGEADAVDTEEAFEPEETKTTAEDNGGGEAEDDDDVSDSKRAAAAAAADANDTEGGRDEEVEVNEGNEATIDVAGGDVATTSGGGAVQKTHKHTAGGENDQDAEKTAEELENEAMLAEQAADKAFEEAQKAQKRLDAFEDSAGGKPAVGEAAEDTGDDDAAPGNDSDKSTIQNEEGDAATIETAEPDAADKKGDEEDAGETTSKKESKDEGEEGDATIKAGDEDTVKEDKVLTLSAGDYIEPGGVAVADKVEPKDAPDVEQDGKKAEKSGDGEDDDDDSTSGEEKKDDEDEEDE